MRILGVSRKWDKLQQPEWTTFRFTRKDKDWQVGELAQVVYKPRSKQREVLGVVEILQKEKRGMARYGDKTGCPIITNAEAVADGFPNTETKDGYFSMWEFLFDTYSGERLLNEPMNKLTVRWRILRLGDQ